MFGPPRHRYQLPDADAPRQPVQRGQTPLRIPREDLVLIGRTGIEGSELYTGTERLGAFATFCLRSADPIFVDHDVHPLADALRQHPLIRQCKFRMELARRRMGKRVRRFCAKQQDVRIAFRYRRVGGVSQAPGRTDRNPGLYGFVLRPEVCRPQKTRPPEQGGHVGLLRPFQIRVAVCLRQVVPGDPECSIQESPPFSGNCSALTSARIVAVRKRRPAWRDAPVAARCSVHLPGPV